MANQNNRQRQVIRLTPTPDYQPKPKPVKIKTKLKPRTQHERARCKMGGSTGGIRIKTEKPTGCPICLTEGMVIEIQVDGQWWWQCECCHEKWDPVDL